MATLSKQVAGTSGLAVTLSAASGGGDLCPTGKGVFLLVKNGDGSSHTVTLATPDTVDGLAVADRVVTVAAGATEVIPLPDDLYRDTDGFAHLTYSAVTSVTVACVSVP